MAQQLVQYEQDIYEIIIDYLNKNRVFELNMVIPYVSSRLSRNEIDLSRQGIAKILQKFLNKNMVVEGSRLTREEILNNEKCKRIYQFIRRNPGVYFYRIVKELNIANHVVVWHLNMLEDFSFISKTAIGKKDIYFEAGLNVKDVKKAYYRNHEKTRAILEFLDSNEDGISKTQLSKRLEMHPNTIKKYINALFDLRLIQRKKLSNKALWFGVKSGHFDEKRDTDEEEEDQRVQIDAAKDYCIVHKGEIRGLIYACPNCGTKYCFRCAKSLQEQGEKCWNCEMDIELE